MANAVGKMGASLMSVFKMKSGTADELKEQIKEIEITVDDTAKSVKAGMQKINEAMSSGVSSNGIEKLNKQIEEYTERMDILKAAQKHFIEAGGSRTDTYYIEKEKEVNRLKDSIEKLKKEHAGYDASLSQTSGAEKFETIGSKVERLREQLKGLRAEGLGEGNEQFDSLYKQLVLAEDELKQYKATLAETARAE